MVHGKGLTFQVVQQLHPLSAFKVTHQGVLGVTYVTALLADSRFLVATPTLPPPPGAFFPFFPNAITVCRDLGAFPR